MWLAIPLSGVAAVLVAWLALPARPRLISSSSLSSRFVSTCDQHRGGARRQGRLLIGTQADVLFEAMLCWLRQHDCLYMVRRQAPAGLLAIPRRGAAEAVGVKRHPVEAVAFTLQPSYPHGRRPDDRCVQPILNHSGFQPDDVIHIVTIAHSGRPDEVPGPLLGLVPCLWQLLWARAPEST